ncbi:MAG: hypothetical protein GX495_09075 [Chloroflexi bacterium]|jgi:hypothetical protein|nr:hypothetical protein [Chloroflexota bacterium]
MDRPVELVPLLCIKCSTPVPAGVDERAWVCANCGQGLVLDEITGLKPLDIYYSALIPSHQTGRPFWMAEGKVTLKRETYGSSGKSGREGEEFWSVPRKFFVPAFSCSLEDMLRLGMDYLVRPPDLNPGPPVSFQPVTLSTEDFPAAAEFVVVALEAGRKDKIRKLDFNLELSTPCLWILP